MRLPLKATVAEALVAVTLRVPVPLSAVGSVPAVNRTLTLQVAPPASRPAQSVLTFEKLGSPTPALLTLELRGLVRAEALMFVTVKSWSVVVPAALGP